MNSSSIRLSAQRMASRNKDAFEQSFNRRRDADSLNRERNQSGGQQVRNIAGSQRSDVYAIFGTSGGGGRVSP